MTKHGPETFTWYSYGLPKNLKVGTKNAGFSYGVDRARYKQVMTTGGTTNGTIHYVGTLFERQTASGTTTYRHYVQVRDRVIALLTRVGTTNTLQYLHRDHQNSVVEVTGSTGLLVQSLAYDAWGLRRNPASWAALATPFTGTQPTKRGYTGHEHVDHVELIHMNGRVQDPRLGRFISADPFIPDPYNSQSFNRYAYVLNNPASLVDPSGFYDCYSIYGSENCGIDVVTVIGTPTGGQSSTFGLETLGARFGSGSTDYASAVSGWAAGQGQLADQTDQPEPEAEPVEEIVVTGVAQAGLLSPDEMLLQLKQVLFTTTPGIQSNVMMRDVSGDATLTVVAEDGRGRTNVAVRVEQRQFDPDQREFRTTAGAVQRFELRAGQQRTLDVDVPRRMSTTDTRSVIVSALSESLSVTVSAEFTHVVRPQLNASN
jgi:RHS repeat-associated protein